MRAAIFKGPHAIEVGERPDPAITAPTDAVVRVVLGCVCGSDLWYYRGETPHAQGSIGHEFIGVVEEVGADVRGIRVNEDVFWVHIRDASGTVHALQKSELKSLDREIDASLMPSYATRIKDAELDDLIAYLSTLRGAK